ncbi:hypothetical protein E1I69_13365 [Bacillus timonensis]|uniref:Uncharacterized protein n=1 Tax=Bacillus timonensis TaxID=1033734 RepID=A0A4S3PQF5_9BACI|nr:hypothetical protein [Bacillus timonensis]THE11870.1 hypothetical protein E1I69_13365 [Bacillus timonensis]
MDKYRNKRYDRNTKNTEEVVHLITLPQSNSEKKVKRVRSEVEVQRKKKKRSALEISDAIGVYGAFGRTLSDLHKQGR